jgi:PAS domain S-box-containing protein
MWGAIRFGVAGAAVSVFVIATAATLMTAFGSGPFAENSAFVNAVLLDVLFAVLSVSGLSLAAVIAERERAESEREDLIRRQAETAARLHLAAIVESSQDAIVSQNLDSVVLSWNLAASSMFGVPESQAVGRPLSSVLPPGLCGDGDGIVQKLRDGARLIRFDTSRVTNNGETMALSISVSPLEDAGGHLIGMARIVRDVSDHKRAEEVLSSVNRRLIEAQEQERARIARELHDDVGQQLAMLAWNLSGHSEEMRNQASQIACDVQTLSRELHPSRIELTGLATGLGSFCREFAEQKQVAVDYSAPAALDALPSNIALTLFRVAQEALRNAAKHSGVQRCEVRLWSSDGWVNLTIRDRGQGFDTDRGELANRGIGLITMRERMKLVDGQLSIDSSPGTGTVVHARAPFNGLSSRPPQVELQDSN